MLVFTSHVLVLLYIALRSSFLLFQVILMLMILMMVTTTMIWGMGLTLSSNWMSFAIKHKEPILSYAYDVLRDFLFLVEQEILILVMFLF